MLAVVPRHYQLEMLIPSRYRTIFIESGKPTKIEKINEHLLVKLARV
jgi:hypothetical protein